MGKFSKYRSIGYNAVPVRYKTKTGFLCKWGQYQNEMPRRQLLWEWDEWKCNLALICGAVSGVVVLDVDDLSLLDKYPALPETVTTQSRQGRHFHFKYFDAPYGFKNEMEPKLEIKADRKTVHLPPSVHPSGFKYHWLRSPFEHPIAELPQSWRDMMVKPKPQEFVITPHDSNRGDWRGYISGLYSAGRGNRNNELNRVAYIVGCRLRTASEMPYAEQELLSAARAIGLTNTEARATIRGALRKGLENAGR